MIKPQQNKAKGKTTRIAVGADEFCSNCMEWREYNEEGKCKVCGKFIKTTKHRDQKDYNEYGIDGVYDGSENEADTSY